MIQIKQIYTNSLCCEPFVRRAPNGELICIAQCDGPTEPHPDNRVYVFHSRDNGETWSDRKLIYPEDGNAVYCTEVMVYQNVMTAFLTIHNGGFLKWNCLMMKSYDNGYTWEKAGAPPYFPQYTFIRSMVELSNGAIVIPYQNYPVTKQEEERILQEDPNQRVSDNPQTPYCESGVLISMDNGKTYEKYMACRMDMSEGWIWSEPTVVELSDGTVAMIARKCRSGFLWRCDSKDGGKTWGDLYNTGIPNPTNKAKLIKLNYNKIALINTPNNVGGEDGWANRYPLEIWISDDDMKTWSDKRTVTDFPGSYSYSDGFYEDGHIKFTIEHNRHTILFIDFEV